MNTLKSINYKPLFSKEELERLITTLSNAIGESTNALSMVKDAGCHSFDVLMSKTRQQNDSQHLLNPLYHYNERTHGCFESMPKKQLRKKTSGASSPKSVKSPY